MVARNFAVSAVAQTVTPGISGNDSTATDYITNATTTSGDNATAGNNTENPLSKVSLIGQSLSDIHTRIEFINDI